MRLRNFLRRSREEQKLLITALCWVACVRAGLWLLPFRILRPVVDRASRNAGPDVADELVAARVAWAISSAARCVPGATCLTQAMAARILLARRGFTSEVCYGVNRVPGRIAAHAWLESGGRVIVGGDRLETWLPLAPLERRVRERRMRAETSAAI